MTYDFDTPVDRRGSGSYKWDSDRSPGLLPLWVADMDFRTAPAITEALAARVAHGIFGYTLVGDEYYKAVVDWFNRRHNWEIDPRKIIYTSGVVPALSAIIKALTRPGDKVLVQTPVYNCFFSSIRNNGCQAVECPLIPCDGTYRMDFDALATAAADPGARLLLLCNPHNPAGRAWTAEELTTLGEICHANGVRVVSDEIHCELVFAPARHIPFASLPGEASAEAIVCISPSKAFNIAGLQIANIVCPDHEVRAAVDRAINDNEVCDVNPFGVAATVAAYNHGEEWLAQLLDYIHANYEFMADYCRRHLPELPLARLEATYLVWMDCRRLAMTSESIEQQLLSDSALWLNAGTMYGAAGEGYMRWNIATQRSVLAEALERFRKWARQRL